jgi:hypothetical protein
MVSVANGGAEPHCRGGPPATPRITSSPQRNDCYDSSRIGPRTSRQGFREQEPSTESGGKGRYGMVT